MGDGSGEGKRAKVAAAVYGAGGAVGRDLLAVLEADSDVESVLAIDDGVEAIDRLPSKARFLRLSESESIEGWFKTSRVKLAIYLAPFPAGTSDAGIGRDDTDVLRRFLSACEVAEVEAISIASGATVYGARKENPPFFVEGAPIKPGGLPPAEVDLSRERLAGEFARRCPQAALSLCRLTQVVGFGTAGLVARFLSAPKFMVLEGFDPPVQFVHAEDVSRCLFKLAKGRKCGVYNLAPDDYTTLMQLGRSFKKPLQRVSERMAQWKTWFGSFVGGIPPSFLPILQYPILLSNRKIKRDTGYTFRYGSEQALAHHAKLAGV